MVNDGMPLGEASAKDSKVPARQRAAQSVADHNGALGLLLLQQGAAYALKIQSIIQASDAWYMHQ
jgi:hypothetical protein